MSEFTVMIAATPGAWTRRAERALGSIQRYAPDVPGLIWSYRRGTTIGDVARFDGLLRIETPWILHLDADVVATGDVRPIMEQLAASGKEFLGRRDFLHDHPEWHQDRYEEMILDARLSYRSVAWGHFALSRDLARRIMPRLGHWMKWFLSYRPLILDRGHDKCHHQLSITMALAEAGIGDVETHWVGSDVFSSHSYPELGLIHHFNGQIYKQLEREGRLESSIEERRHG